MTPEKLEEINALDYFSHYKNYGIRNTKKRISLYYGDDCGLALQSVLNEGTIVTLTLKRLVLTLP